MLLTDVNDNIVAELHSVVLELYYQLPEPVASSDSKLYTLDTNVLEVLGIAACCLSKIPSAIILPKLFADMDGARSRSLWVLAILVSLGYAPAASTIHRVNSWFLLSNRGTHSDHVSLSALMIPISVAWPLRCIKNGSVSLQWILDVLETILLTTQPIVAGLLLGYVCLASCDETALLECIVSKKQTKTPISKEHLDFLTKV